MKKRLVKYKPVVSIQVDDALVFARGASGLDAACYAAATDLSQSTGIDHRWHDTMGASSV
jgi:hypothetical protein